MADYVEEQIVRHEWTGNTDNISYGPLLIRCKDCKYGERCTNGAKLPAVQCFNSDNGEFGYCHDPEWFCADGEAKE